MVTVGEILYILVMRERALRLSILDKTSADILKYFSYFSRKTRFDISCKLPASVAQLDASSNWRPGGRGFNAR